VLRQVNTVLPERLRPRRAYRVDGKQWLGLTHLIAQKGDRIALPLPWQDWCADQIARVVADLSDVDVVGDLADLRVEAADFVSEELIPDQVALPGSGPRGRRGDPGSDPGSA
jgi:hypothetical protein